MPVRRLLPSLLVLGVCFAGLVWQVSHVSLQYFAYRTTSRTELVTPRQLRHLKVAFCVRFIDLMDVERVFRETGVRLSRSQALDAEAFRFAVANEGRLTLRQIFHFTPEAQQQLIVSCMHRPDDWDVHVDGDAEACARALNVSQRFLSQESMCYVIERRSPLTYSRSAVLLSTFYRRRVWEVTLSRVMDPAFLVNGVTFADGLPWTSRETAAAFFVRFSAADGGRRSFDVLSLTPTHTTIRLLSRPFDTGCVPASGEQPHECRKRCLLREYASVDRIPAPTILLESDLTRVGHLTLSSVRDARNRTLRSLFARFERTCEVACQQVVCEQQLTRTYATPEFRSEKLVGLALLAPLDPDLVTTAQPRMSFIDFFSFLASCFGTWFGISFLSLDPASRSRRLRRRLRRQFLRVICPRVSKQSRHMRTPDDSREAGNQILLGVSHKP